MFKEVFSFTPSDLRQALVALMMEKEWSLAKLAAHAVVNVLTMRKFINGGVIQNKSYLKLVKLAEKHRANA